MFFNLVLGAVIIWSVYTICRFWIVLMSLTLANLHLSENSLLKEIEQKDQEQYRKMFRDGAYLTQGALSADEQRLRFLRTDILLELRRRALPFFGAVVMLIASCVALILLKNGFTDQSIKPLLIFGVVVIGAIISFRRVKFGGS